LDAGFILSMLGFLWAREKTVFVCFAGFRHPSQFFLDNIVFGKNGLCRSAEPRHHDQVYE
jgi:hypothetical protein